MRITRGHHVRETWYVNQSARTATTKEVPSCRMIFHVNITEADVGPVTRQQILNDGSKKLIDAAQVEEAQRDEIERYRLRRDRRRD